MIELQGNRLVFRFPEVHEAAVLNIEFQRTLRIPDNDKEYPLPAGLGPFPLKSVDDFATHVPDEWLEHGGVMLPMYQSEALWIHFGFGGWFGDHSGKPTYPFVVKIAAGKVDAITGKGWTHQFERQPQNYLMIPRQPWLDGFCVEKGVIRQFVAMPLGSGYSAEEQVRGTAEHGGIQIVASPMKPEVYERLCKERHRGSECLMDFCGETETALCGMGLAPGGRMRQEIFEDPYELTDWDLEHASRCFVHLANSLVWRSITGEQPPTVPPTGKEYAAAGIPWFDYYAEDATALMGSNVLAKLKSVLQMAKEKGDVPLPENEPTAVDKVIVLRDGLRPGQVREGRF
jgi:hypothetical protein